ncbi:VacJ family lipoprotein [bacterium]|nr:VacJ family lipoprotein [bacterium]
MKHARLLGIALAVTLAGCAHSPTYDPSDPLEGVNRGVYAFNSTADKYVVRPVAKGYVAVTPGFVRKGVTNFFANLGYPLTIVNQFLQGKPVEGVSDTGRFLVNSTLGIAGLFDPASALGLQAHEEDFGQTFGKWGVGQGWYLMLPFLGPSTNRDFTGRLVGSPLNPTFYVDEPEVVFGLNVLDIINTRALLLSTDRLVRQAYDPYVFVRDAYLQTRRAAVYDGNPPREDFDFEEDFEDE